MTIKELALKFHTGAQVTGKKKMFSGETVTMKGTVLNSGLVNCKVLDKKSVKMEMDILWENGQESRETSFTVEAA